MHNTGHGRYAEVPGVTLDSLLGTPEREGSVQLVCSTHARCCQLAIARCPTAEQDEQQEDEPGHGVGDDEAAPDGAHAAEEVDGHLVRQEADQPEAKVPAPKKPSART